MSSLSDVHNLKYPNPVGELMVLQHRNSTCLLPLSAEQGISHIIQRCCGENLVTNGEENVPHETDACRNFTPPTSGVPCWVMITPQDMWQE